jgi:hypothetical protein
MDRIDYGGEMVVNTSTIVNPVHPVHPVHRGALDDALQEIGPMAKGKGADTLTKGIHML